MNSGWLKSLNVTRSRSSKTSSRRGVRIRSWTCSPSLKIALTAEQASQLFERYIYDAIRKFPTLNSPTKLDFGSARVIVLDLQEVAPTGSAASNRQTEMMYLLARHILARNFFLKPDYLRYVPEPVRRYHAQRFQDNYETVRDSITTSGIAHWEARKSAPRLSSIPAKAESTIFNLVFPASACPTWEIR